MALAALVTTVVVAPSATAHKRLYNTSTSISLNKASGSDSISGQVASKGVCRGNRAVVVYEDVDTSVAGGISEIGRTVTTSTGAWSLQVQGSIKKDRGYYARTSKRKVAVKGNHKHVCKAATSPTAVGT